MPAEPRPLAARLRGGERLLGLVVKIPCPQIVESAGWCGYDLVVIDSEHGPADTEALEHHLRAADAVGIPALVRVGNNAGDEILRALDAGAQGVVVPHVNSAAEAVEAVAAAHYPPGGTRGLATSTRAGRHGLVGAVEHVERAREQTVVFAQIEDAAAVPHAGAIASVPGVDAVFLGPSDLSMSLGHPGDLAHPTVDAAIGEIAGAVHAARAGALCTLVGNPEAARSWWERGAQVVLFAAPAVISKHLNEIALAVRGPGAGRDEDVVLEEVSP
jgi:4-hydroxy-2-oxoheptanedioate aldolase